MPAHTNCTYTKTHLAVYKTGPIYYVCIWYIGMSMTIGCIMANNAIHIYLIHTLFRLLAAMQC